MLRRTGMTIPEKASTVKSLASPTELYKSHAICNLLYCSSKMLKQVYVVVGSRYRKVLIIYNKS